jgi:transposase-like protein
VILDGSKALHRAVTDLFGHAALIQRCQVHKRHNILEHGPERQRPWVRAILNRASARGDVATPRR